MGALPPLFAFILCFEYESNMFEIPPKNWENHPAICEFCDLWACGTSAPSFGGSLNGAVSNGPRRENDLFGTQDAKPCDAFSQCQVETSSHVPIVAHCLFIEEYRNQQNTFQYDYVDIYWFWVTCMHNVTLKLFPHACWVWCTTACLPGPVWTLINQAAIGVTKTWEVQKFWQKT